MFNPAMRDGFYTREAVETYIAAANKCPGEFLFDGRRGRDWPTRQYGRLISPWIASLGCTRASLGRFRCAEPRLPSSTAALVRDDGALGLGVNIFYLPRLFAIRTWKGNCGSNGGGPSLARERQPRPGKTTIVQVKSIEGAVDPELLSVAIFTEQRFRYCLKSNFRLTEETGEHNLIEAEPNASGSGVTA